MSEPNDDKRDIILDAAREVFGRYGYKRTSMDLIAQAAGMSRPALYQHFKGKGEVFQAAAERMLNEVIEAIEAAGRAPGTVTDRLYRALAVRLDFFVGNVEAEFRCELANEAKTLASGAMAAYKRRQNAAIRDVLAGAGLGLSEAAADEVAAILADALSGISQAAVPLEILHDRLRRLVELTVRGLMNP